MSSAGPGTGWGALLQHSGSVLPGRWGAGCATHPTPSTSRQELQEPEASRSEGGAKGDPRTMHAAGLQVAFCLPSGIMLFLSRQGHRGNASQPSMPCLNPAHLQHSALLSKPTAEEKELPLPMGSTAPGHAGVKGRGRRTPSLPQALGSPMYFLINV